MNSLRPFVTMTIIALVGVFLYTKLNQEPPKLPPGMNEALQNAPADVPPPLAVSSPTTLTPVPPSATETPQWTPPVTEPISGDSAAPATNESAGAPAVPAMPELPPLPSATQFSEAAPVPAATAPVVADQPPAVALPSDLPATRYPTEQANTISPPVAPTTETPTTTNAVSAAAPDTSTSPMAARMPSMGAATTPVEPSFAASWAEVQAALARQDISQAHQMLSRWYENPTLTPAESQQVTALLGQLAGTVVYSTEHRLEPPYVVKPGDTLETIAAQYEVPWQLLAKINGIPAADGVRPGQELKVIHGPFSAVVNLSKSEMTLLLGDRYAGQFALTSDVTIASEGEWLVVQKLANPSAVAASAYAASPVVDHVIVLGANARAVNPATIAIADAPTPTSGPPGAAPTAIRLSSSDAEEVADILSVGSRVTIRK